MPPAETLSSAALDAHIDRVYRDFADITGLVADEQSAAQAAADARVPPLQQKIDLKQKELTRLRKEIQVIERGQEEDRQEIVRLKLGVEAANQRSRRVATLAANVSKTTTASNRTRSSIHSGSNITTAPRGPVAGSSADPRCASAPPSTRSDIGRLALDVVNDLQAAGLASGEASASGLLIRSEPVVILDNPAVLPPPSSPDTTVDELSESFSSSNRSGRVQRSKAKWFTPAKRTATYSSNRVHRSQSGPQLAIQDASEVDESRNNHTATCRPRSLQSPNCENDIRLSTRHRQTPRLRSLNGSSSLPAISNASSARPQKRRRLNENVSSSDLIDYTLQTRKSFGLTRTLRQGGLSDTVSEALTDDNLQHTPQKQNPPEGIVYPEVGKPYLGRWGSNSAAKRSAWYAIIVLPLDDFETVRIAGSIADTGLTDGYIPVCYKSGQKHIHGWKEGYQDGGPQVSKRKFPVFWFQDDEYLVLQGEKFHFPSLSFFSWLPASKIQPISEYGPDGSPVSGYDAALRFSAELDGMRKAKATESSYNESLRSSHDSSRSSQAEAATETGIFTVANMSCAPDPTDSPITVQEPEQDLWRSENTPHDADLQNVGEMRLSIRQSSPLGGEAGTHLTPPRPDLKQLSGSAMVNLQSAVMEPFLSPEHLSTHRSGIEPSPGGSLAPALPPPVYHEDRSSSASSRILSPSSLAVVTENPDADAPYQPQSSTTVQERKDVVVGAERRLHDNDIQDDKEVEPTEPTSRQNYPLSADVGGTHPFPRETSGSLTSTAPSTCQLVSETITSAISTSSMLQLASEAAAVAGREYPAFVQSATVSNYQPQRVTHTDELNGDDPRSPIVELTFTQFPSTWPGSGPSVEQREPFEHFQHESGGTRGVHVVDHGIELVQEGRTSPTQTVASNSLVTPVSQAAETSGDNSGSVEVEASQDHRAEVEGESILTTAGRPLMWRPLMAAPPHKEPIPAMFAKQEVTSAAGPARRNLQLLPRNPSHVNNFGESSSPCNNQSSDSQSTAEPAQTTLSPLHPTLTRQVPLEGPHPTMALQHVLSADIQTSPPEPHQEPLGASGQSHELSALHMGHAAQVASTADRNPRWPSINFEESAKDCQSLSFLASNPADGEDFLYDMVRLYEPNKGKGMWNLVTLAFNHRFGCEETKEALQMRYGRSKRRKIFE